MYISYIPYIISLTNNLFNFNLIEMSWFLVQNCLLKTKLYSKIQIPLKCLLSLNICISLKKTLLMTPVLMKKSLPKAIRKFKPSGKISVKYLSPSVLVLILFLE